MRQKPILPALLALAVSSIGYTGSYAAPTLPVDSTRKPPKITKRRRWSLNAPHVGAQQQARLEKRVINDTWSASMNYAGWCGKS